MYDTEEACDYSLQSLPRHYRKVNRGTGCIVPVDVSMFALKSRILSPSPGNPVSAYVTNGRLTRATNTTGADRPVGLLVQLLRHYVASTIRKRT